MGLTIDPSSARLLLFMLGKGASRIRPGEYTAEQTMEMENRLREVADDAS